ncbi:MAG: hypothetical protein FWF44_00930 [Defluviitaleaceae bacterium]|nr:hypothetical protein [Defluviitaleaceae bacterium]
MKTKQIVLLAACVVVVAAITLLVVYGTSAYTRYSDAFNNLPKTTKYLDMDASLNFTVDGNTTTASGNLLLDNDGQKYLYSGNMAGTDFKQFTDGQYMYLDTGANKIQYQSGTTSPLEDTSDFSVDNYIHNYAALIDLSNMESCFGQFGPMSKLSQYASASSTGTTVSAQIKNISRKTTGSGYEYTVTLTDSYRDSIFNAITAVQSDWTQKPDAQLATMSYIMDTDSNNLVTATAVTLNMNVTFDATMTGTTSVTKNIDMTFKFTINSMNKTLTFDVPATDGFTPNFTPTPTDTPAPTDDTSATDTATP